MHFFCQRTIAAAVILSAAHIYASPVPLIAEILEKAVEKVGKVSTVMSAKDVVGSAFSSSSGAAPAAEPIAAPGAGPAQ